MAGALPPVEVVSAPAPLAADPDAPVALPDDVVCWPVVAVPGAAVAVVVGRAVVVGDEPAEALAVVVVSGGFVVAVALVVVVVVGAVVGVVGTGVGEVDAGDTIRVVLWPRWSCGLQYRMNVPALSIGGMVKVFPAPRLPEWMPSSSTSTVWGVPGPPSSTVKRSWSPTLASTLPSPTVASSK